MVRTIRTEQVIGAPPALVHELLCDVASWSVWSPHIASVEPSEGTVHEGWRGEVRAWFSPVPTEMHVTWCEPGKGLRWESEALGHRLLYADLLEPHAEGTLATMEARLEGPAAGTLQAVAAPLSSLGQRRRLRRLGRLAELIARQAAL